MVDGNKIDANKSASLVQYHCTIAKNESCDNVVRNRTTVGRIIRPARLINACRADRENLGATCHLGSIHFSRTRELMFVCWILAAPPQHWATSKIPDQMESWAIPSNRV
jgi:hypothetical protein